MISSSDYQFIANRVSSIKQDASKMSENIVRIRQTLDNLVTTDTDPNKQRLRLSVEETYTIVIQRHVSNTPLLLELVRRLQLHVESRSGTVDDFLSDNGITVSSQFANVSAEAGFTISEDNID
tara:strand:+ start:55 stop:423 length:369 start_codon:yes stop_codon:yes gene_type:complete